MVATGLVWRFVSFKTCCSILTLYSYSVSWHGSRTGIQLENVPCIPGMLSSFTTITAMIDLFVLDGPDEQHLEPIDVRDACWEPAAQFYRVSV
jgi:hypothetical protein